MKISHDFFSYLEDCYEAWNENPDPNSSLVEDVCQHVSFVPEWQALGRDEFIKILFDISVDQKVRCSFKSCKGWNKSIQSASIQEILDELKQSLTPQFKSLLENSDLYSFVETVIKRYQRGQSAKTEPLYIEGLLVRVAQIVERYRSFKSDGGNLRSRLDGIRLEGYSENEILSLILDAYLDQVCCDFLNQRNAWIAREDPQTKKKVCQSLCRLLISDLPLDLDLYFQQTQVQWLTLQALNRSLKRKSSIFAPLNHQELLTWIERAKK